jgi:hypothetical protein
MRIRIIYNLFFKVHVIIGTLNRYVRYLMWFFLNRIQKGAEAALDAEYPSYGITGPSSGSKISPNSAISDRKLAQSAQMFHYQQQRQQMMAQEKYVVFYRI